MSVLSLWPYQPELQFFDRLRAFWHRIQRGRPSADDLIDTGWFTNETGNVSCKTVIFPMPSGSWGATVVSRNGFHKGDFSYDYKSFMTLFPSQVAALRAAEQLAKQFVCLRYRYYYGVKRLVCVPAA
ncbi:MAG: hypothetical protein WBR09_22705 [Serratia proteamaculans]